MKPEVYSCIKMLEAFHKVCIDIYNSTRNHGLAPELREQYIFILDKLEKNLEKERFEFIPKVGYRMIYSTSSSDNTLLLQELISASSIAISFLRSLDSSLEKELKEKETELGLKEKEISSLKKILEKSIEAVKELPEVQRSKSVAEWKKAHRDIEEYTRKQKKTGRPSINFV